MNPKDFETMLLRRRSLFLNFRWLLFLWLGAVAALKSGAGLEIPGQLALAIFLMVASQAGLWRLPLKHLDGGVALHAIFLLDLLISVIGISCVDGLNQDLLIALFLGTFIAALAQRIDHAALGSLALAGVYITLKARSADGFDMSQAGHLLNLPFLFIASVHSGLLSQESAHEVRARRRLSQDRNMLANDLENSFGAIARFGHEVSGLLDTLPYGIVMVDRQGTVRYFNSMAEFALGTPRRNVCKKPLNSHPSLAALEPAIRKTMENPESNGACVEIQADMGQPCQMELSTFPVVDGEDGNAMGELILLVPHSYRQAPVANPLLAAAA